MPRTSPAVRIVEVNDLGRDGVIVRVDGKVLLLVDSTLDWDQRISVMSRAMEQV